VTPVTPARFPRLRRAVSMADNVLLAVVVAGGGAWGYRALTDKPEPPVPVERGLPPASTSEGFEPLEVLATLDVKGRAPKTGYDRKYFGVGAIDYDKNGCDYRNDTLRRDLQSQVLRPGEPVCVVESGTLLDPYTGDQVSFVRGANPSPIEIDHLVALSDAWQKGAQQWSEGKLLQFGNDPRNLVATSRQANQAKKDHDAASWLPPNKAFRCTYVTRQIEVKATYGLWVTAAERETMEAVLAGCDP
jgi:hypothetical protein